jgi:nucleoside-diphosphate-sugar epimerase
MQLADASARAGVKQFLYASSGSVYGVSDEPLVTEEVPLVPLSEYNKTKMVAERVLLSYADRMAIQILRPATVCGMSAGRQRFDVVVNMLTMQAMTGNLIKVLGGTQMRPNIHIDDMCDLYLWMLDRPNLTGIYNAGFENLSVSEIARMVSDRVNCRTVQLPSNDPRSYRLNSDKILATGFKPKYTVKDAIDGIVNAFKDGKVINDDRWHNLKSMPR